MNKNRIGFAAWLFCLLFLITSIHLPAYASAADAAPECTLTLDFHYDGEIAIPDVRFDLYYAGSIRNNNTIIAAEPIAQYPLSYDYLTAEQWQELAQTLKGYLLRDKVAPLMSGTTNEEGRVTFEGLKPGLYFVLGGSQTVGEYLYTAKPFFTALPGRDEETSKPEYNVLSHVKYEREKIGTETQSIKALKIWKDDGREAARPDDIEITLLCDGEVYDTQTLSEENSWRYEWNDLPSGHDWSVAETQVKGYTAKIQSEGWEFVITNTRAEQTPTPSKTPVPSKTPPPELPYTGVTRWPVPVLLCAGLVFVLVGLLKRRSFEGE